MNPSYRDLIKSTSLVTSRTFQEEGSELAARSYMGAVAGRLGGRSSSGSATGQQGDFGQVTEAREPQRPRLLNGAIQNTQPQASQDIRPPHMTIAPLLPRHRPP